MSIALDLHFTEPAAPLFIDAECDTFPVESLFVISTSQPPGGAPAASQSQSSASSSRKRPREADSSTAGRAPERRRPQKVVERTDPASLARQIRDKQSMPPPSLPFIRANGDSQPPPQREPLFLPSSQLSQADEQALRDSGLGDMNADEFNAMLEDEGVEVGGAQDDDFMMPPPSFGIPYGQVNGDSFELVDELGPTQEDVSQNSANRVSDLIVVTSVVALIRAQYTRHSNRSSTIDTQLHLYCGSSFPMLFAPSWTLLFHLFIALSCCRYVYMSFCQFACRPFPSVGLLRWHLSVYINSIRGSRFLTRSCRVQLELYAQRAPVTRIM